MAKIEIVITASRTGGKKVELLKFEDVVTREADGYKHEIELKTRGTARNVIRQELMHLVNALAELETGANATATAAGSETCH